MYADRHARSSGLDPRSLAIAVAVNGAVVGALLLAQPVLTIVKPDPPLTTYAVPIQPPPEPVPPKPEADQRAAHVPVTVPRTVVDLPKLPTEMVTGEVILPPPPVDTGPIFTPVPIPTPALTTTAPEIDPAHRGDLQPVYPAAELRAEHEGVVTVRVLIGVDGRVGAVERVTATSDAFFAATERQARMRWRFRPAMRGGVPVEAWRTMTIRFVMPR